MEQAVRLPGTSESVFYLFMRKPAGAAFFVLLIVFGLAGQSPAPAPRSATAADLAAIQKYIHETWHTLTRSNAQLASAAVDPKFAPGPGGRWPVYISQSEDLAAIQQRLRQRMLDDDFARIDLRRLPEHVEQPGLLYLPEAYVVPGGRFNEMYGWDSYFIQVGLLRDGENALAKDMADNFLYEIRNYGKILNANRTYYLTRSQPPFLTQMVLGVYQRTHDKEWLRATIPQIERYYRFWTTEPHLTPATGLSRYYDLGDGPAPEVLSSEKDDQGRNHYELVKNFYKTHRVADYEMTEYFHPATDRLTDLFYKGDRSMRESGFDPSNRFGPFNIDVIHYNPVCLNSLLYIMEQQTAEILDIADRGSESGAWRSRAASRKKKVNELMWDEQDGLYYDYHFLHKKLRRYPFLTTFYPMWAGIAEPAQAAKIVMNLGKFERAGGLMTSTNQSGNQWDAPFGWAPLEMIAVEGMRRYGFAGNADRITAKFLSLILDDFMRNHRIVEKYDVVRRASNVSGSIGFGYRSNEAGFGWTNAAFEELYAEMPARSKNEILK